MVDDRWLQIKQASHRSARLTRALHRGELAHPSRLTSLHARFRGFWVRVCMGGLSISELLKQVKLVNVHDAFAYLESPGMPAESS